MAYASCQFDVTDEEGNVLRGATIEVRRETGGLQVVYKDRDALIPLGSTFICEDYRVQFFAPGDAYRILMTLGNFSRELRYVAVGLAAETDMTILNPSGEWDSGTTYSTGDYVSKDGYYGFASRTTENLNHTPVTSPEPADSEDWMYIPASIGIPGTGDKFDLSIFVGGRPRAGEIVGMHTFSGTGITFQQLLGESSARARVASDGDVSFKILKNGAEIGSVRFNNSTVGVFTFPNDVQFEQNDIISIIAPSPRDQSLTDTAITISGNRT